jgi:20S proteasome alpha/beta subunit
LEPSGTFLEYEAKAIGSGSEGAQQNLQDIYHKVKKLFHFSINQRDSLLFYSSSFNRQ